MSWRLGSAALVAAAVGYLVLFGIAVNTSSYDVWGVLVVIPVYGWLGVLAMRRLFPRPHQAIATIMSLGLAMKLAGAAARYYVGFEAYDGAIDAGRYHEFASARAAEVWAGDWSWFDLLPRSTGTAFTEEFTALLYSFTGASRLAGFVTFSFLAYLGIAFMVKAALIAIPDLLGRRYAWLCVLAPSIAYWPSSIGKEALMTFSLGVATYGIARLLARQGWVVPLLLAAAGLGFTAFVRPHLAGIWLAGALPGVAVAAITGRAAGSRTAGRAGNRVALGGVLVVAGLGLAVIARYAVRYLSFGDEDASVTSILEETTRRTVQAGSSFTPPSIASPFQWPFAVVRTLLRPLPHEAVGLAQLLSAAEIAALVLLLLVSYKRVFNLPRLLLTNSYVAFAMSTLFIAGLAYSSFGNLGVLTRQKSLVFPLMLLIACLPTRSEERAATATWEAEEARAALVAAELRARAEARRAGRPRVERPLVGAGASAGGGALAPSHAGATGFGWGSGHAAGVATSVEHQPGGLADMGSLPPPSAGLAAMGASASAAAPPRTRSTSVVRSRRSGVPADRSAASSVDPADFDDLWR
jgi:hypothetical protein